MKRIILVSMYVIASMVLFSCTDDIAETSPNNSTEKVIADDPADPISPTPAPRPK